MGRTVELDESKFGIRKYNRGKQWGSVSWSLKRRGMENTLIPIKEEWILPESTVIMDFWKTYDCMDKEKYLKDNHSPYDKDLETGAHTNRAHTDRRSAKRF